MKEGALSVLAVQEAEKGQHGGNTPRKHLGLLWGREEAQHSQDSSVKPQDDGKTDSHGILVLIVENRNISSAPLGETDLAL